MSGSCSASCISARWSAPCPPPRHGPAAVSSVGGGKCPDRSHAAGSPRDHRSAPRARPQIFRVSSAATDPYRSERPDAPSNPPTPSPSRSLRVDPRTRSRRRRPRYAISSPASSRSILNTVAEERGRPPRPAPCEGGGSGIPPICSLKAGPAQAGPAKGAVHDHFAACAASARAKLFLFHAAPPPTYDGQGVSSSFSDERGAGGSTVGPRRQPCQPLLMSASPAPDRPLRGRSC